MIHLMLAGNSSWYKGQEARTRTAAVTWLLHTKLQPLQWQGRAGGGYQWAAFEGHFVGCFAQGSTSQGLQSNCQVERTVLLNTSQCGWKKKKSFWQSAQRSPLMMEKNISNNNNNETLGLQGAHKDPSTRDDTHTACFGGWRGWRGDWSIS